MRAGQDAGTHLRPRHAARQRPGGVRAPGRRPPGCDRRAEARRHRPHDIGQADHGVADDQLQERRAEPNIEKNCSNATPVTMSGTISGDRTSPRTASRPGTGYRAKPSAHGMPSRSVTMATAKASFSEQKRRARIHVGQHLAVPMQREAARRKHDKGRVGDRHQERHDQRRQHQGDDHADQDPHENGSNFHHAPSTFAVQRENRRLTMRRNTMLAVSTMAIRSVEIAARTASRSVSASAARSACRAAERNCRRGSAA